MNKAKITGWLVKGNHLELLFLLLILVLGAFLRLYRISEYMTFRGDEGRDALVVRQLLQGEPILTGPETSTGGMLLGPLYYYLMAPALFLANYSPIGPAVMVALLGVATIFLVWWVARQWYGWIPALVAALLYAVAATVIYFSRFSWNPNIMPFFSLLTVYAAWRVWERSDFKWAVVLGIAYATVLQSHYLGLLLLPVIGIAWLMALLKVRRDRSRLMRLAAGSLAGLLAFLLLMSTLIYFDFRHGWVNLAALQKFLSAAGPVSSPALLPRLKEILLAFSSLLIPGADGTQGILIAILLFAGAAVLAIKQLPTLLSNVQLSTFNVRTSLERTCSERTCSPKTSSSILLFAWIACGLVGFAVYSGDLFGHYYEFLFPAPFLLLAGLVQAAGELPQMRLARLGFLAVLLLLMAANVWRSPLRSPPERQLQRSETVARLIQDQAGGQALNLEVIGELNYEDAYQYFLEGWNISVVDIDPKQLKKTVASQVFVVCELPRPACDPTHQPKTRLAKFGRSEIAGEWQVAGVTVYKLFHNP